HATFPFSRSIRARTRSPGAASGTNVTRPSSAARAPCPPCWRPTASPPGASDSISTPTSLRNWVAKVAAWNAGAAGRLREGLRALPAREIEVEVAHQIAAYDRLGRHVVAHDLRSQDAVIAEHGDVEVGAQPIAKVH